MNGVSELHASDDAPSRLTRPTCDPGETSLGIDVIYHLKNILRCDVAIVIDIKASGGFQSGILPRIWVFPDRYGELVTGQQPTGGA